MVLEILANHQKSKTKIDRSDQINSDDKVRSKWDIGVRSSNSNFAQAQACCTKRFVSYPLSFVLSKGDR